VLGLPGTEKATVVETWCFPGTSPIEPDMVHLIEVLVPTAEVNESVWSGGVAAGAPTRLTFRA